MRSPLARDCFREGARCGGRREKTKGPLQPWRLCSLRRWLRQRQSRPRAHGSGRKLDPLVRLKTQRANRRGLLVARLSAFCQPAIVFSFLGFVSVTSHVVVWVGLVPDHATGGSFTSFLLLGITEPLAVSLRARVLDCRSTTRRLILVATIRVLDLLRVYGMSMLLICNDVFGNNDRAV